jgi:UDP-glucose 4-epimerase
MNILITGGSGYIAGRLSLYLKNSPSDYEVSLVSRRKDFTRPNDISSIKLDWDNFNSLDEGCPNIDTLVHSAGLNAQECKNSFIDAYNVNTINTAKLLEYAINKGVKRFIYISTAHVYGSNLSGKINESYPANSFEAYAASHRAAEDLVLNAYHKGDIEGIVIRLSNSYGAPLSKEVNCWNLLVNDLCYMGVSKNKLIINSSGRQIRDFVPMGIVVRAIEHLICLPNNLIGNGIFNLGSGHSSSVIETAEKIAKVFLSEYNDVTRIYKKRHTHSNAKTKNSFYIYDTSKLLNTGFTYEDISEVEIINLIKFIKTNFALK